MMVQPVQAGVVRIPERAAPGNGGGVTRAKMRIQTGYMHGQELEVKRNG